MTPDSNKPEERSREQRGSEWKPRPQGTWLVVPYDAADIGARPAPEGDPVCTSVSIRVSGPTSLEICVQGPTSLEIWVSGPTSLAIRVSGPASLEISVPGLGSLGQQSA